MAARQSGGPASRRHPSNSSRGKPSDSQAVKPWIADSRSRPWQVPRHRRRGGRLEAWFGYALVCEVVSKGRTILGALELLSLRSIVF